MYKRLCNPLLPPEYHFADPEVHHMDGITYIYGSCDVAPEHYCSDKYYMAYSNDLLNFNVSKVIFSTNDVTWGKEAKIHSSLEGISSYDDLPEHIKKQLPDGAENIPIQSLIEAIDAHSKKGLPKEQLLYAPDALKINGKNCLFFCTSDDSEGVSFSDSMKGYFTESKRIKIENGDYIQGIDPAVFLDDDGKCYYYWGQFKANVGELTDDLTMIKSESYIEGVLGEHTHFFHEGSSMRRRGDIYYYVYASVVRGKPSCLAYSIGKSPIGPFEYKGIVVDNDGCDPKVWNNHGSIECINGEWYVFYHRSSEHSSSMRQICAEPILFDDDGLIFESKITSQGIGEAFKLNEVIPAYTACQIEGEGFTKEYDFKVPEGNGRAYYRYISLENVGSSILLKGTGYGEINLSVRQVASIEADRFNKSSSTDNKIYLIGDFIFNNTTEADIYLAPGEYELVLDINNADRFCIDEIIIGG